MIKESIRFGRWTDSGSLVHEKTSAKEIGHGLGMKQISRTSEGGKVQMLAEEIMANGLAMVIRGNFLIPEIVMVIPQKAGDVSCCYHGTTRGIETVH